MFLSNIHECICQLAEAYNLELLSGQEGIEFGQTVQAQATIADSSGQVIEEGTADLPLIGKAFVKFSSIFDALGLNLETNVSARGFYEGLELHAVALHHKNNNSSKRSAASLMLVMMLPKSLDLRLNIYPEKALHSLGKYLLRLQDIQTGDPELDPKVMIKAEKVQQAKLLLSQQKVQTTLLSLFDNEYQTAAVNDISVRLISRRTPAQDEFQGILERLHQATLALSTACG